VKDLKVGMAGDRRSTSAHIRRLIRSEVPATFIPRRAQASQVCAKFFFHFPLGPRPAKQELQQCAD
jgi:hypothetical protein